MTIEKKSLISALKTTMKANAAKEDISGDATISTSQKMPGFKNPGFKNKGFKNKGFKNKGFKNKGFKNKAVKE